MSATDSIAAIATPPGIGGVGVIRISGPNAKQIGEALTQKKPIHQKAIYSQFLDKDANTIDSGYLLYFQSPNSFTGEDVIEVQGHGGPVVMDMLLQRIFQLGARAAEAGEFSKQAFLNDKIDLVQAEAIADLIESSSQSSVRQAQRSLQGAFSKEINNIADKIIYLRMYVEAALDFPEEEIDFISDAKVVQQLQDLLALLTAILAKASQGAIVREGIQLVIIGKPNVGKSTLINQLSGEETAIVTPIAGTTRDILKERILINDVPVSIIDTAGLRDSDDVVEQEGVRRAKLATNTADLVMLVADINSHDQQDLEALKTEHDIRQPVLHVFNKIDMQQQMNENEESTVYISAKEGQGIDALKQQILAKIGLANKEIESGYSARRRHLNALEQSLSLVQTGYDNLTQHNAGELLAEDLKLAHRALGEITGEFSADDLLGKIFSSFCIGK